MGLEIVVGSLVIMVGFCLFAIERLRAEHERHEKELTALSMSIDKILNNLKYVNKDLENTKGEF